VYIFHKIIGFAVYPEIDVPQLHKGLSSAKPEKVATELNFPLRAVNAIEHIL